MKTVLHIVGARPQFVKLAPLVREMNGCFRNLILHTGQHYDHNMSEQFFNDLDIPKPDFNLEIGSGNHGAQTAGMLSGIEHLLLSEKPDMVVVYGDTNSTLAGALAAVKLHIPTAHVEAGLRSFNTSMPEEINRVCADQICDILLAPTPVAMDNLFNEGLKSRSYLVGDIMTDSVAYAIQKASGKQDVLDKLQLEKGKYLLLTLHRPYNVDDPQELIDILNKIDGLGMPVLFPVHPRTQNVLIKGDGISFKHVIMTDPQPYLEFIVLMKNCKMILTDSGGIQKEAYLMQKPCVTLRTETEWVETINSGWNLLLPPASANFAQQILSFNPQGTQPSIFGENVSQKITAICKDYLERN